MTYNHMHFAREFPDYPASDMPELPAAGRFTDTSWHNDICPSFTSDLLGLTIWIDYPAVEMREHGGRRFIVQSQDHGIETSRFYFETDDWQAVLRYVNEHTPVVPWGPYCRTATRLTLIPCGNVEPIL